jgi:N-acetylmuramic acid 6-phosphate etherase
MKAGTATKLVLNTITTGAMVRIGKVYSNLMVDLQVTCEKLRDRGERILSELLNLDQPAAAALLDRASGDVKAALVMGHLGIDREEALKRLDAAGGVVSMVIGSL